jgi:adenylylsulfate kinase-like enzyme
MSAGWSEPAVVIITGIQASGKSTVGLLLAEWIRAPPSLTATTSRAWWFLEERG